MVITVIGHLCLDVIEHPDGTETEHFGGIYFSVATLAALLKKSDTVQPVFGVGKAEYEMLMDRLSVYPNVDPAGIYKFNGPTNRVRLTYTTTQQRIECSKHIAEPIPWKKIRPWASANVILINMISGFDLTLETLDQIRMETRDDRTPIYFDVHCLPYGVDGNCTRIPHPVETWRRWLFMLHAAQVNEAELKALPQEPMEERSFATHVLALNTDVLHVTKGERGSVLYTNEHKHIKQKDFPAFDPEKAVDTTGCGDVFGAAYCAYYLRSKDVVASTRFANRVASLNAQFAGSEGIDKLSVYRTDEFKETEENV
jgi:sugar/nucleoside kinase (ribokinase family)